MRKIVLVIAFAGLLMQNSFADNTEGRILQVEKRISVLQQSNSRLSANVRELTRQNRMMKADIDSLQAMVQRQAKEIADQSSRQKSNIQRLDGLLEETNGNVEQNKATLGQRTTWGIVASFLLLALICIAVYLLRKRISQGSSTIDEVKSAQNKLQEAQMKLQEESIKLDQKLVEVLDKQLPAIDSQGKTEEPDHSLALKVADELVRIEKNLSNMDASTKGYKPLSKAVQRIKDNFMAYGYEMVEMLGKPYSDGMRALVTFVTDENMKEGEKIITRVIKPQVNYNGVMIQIAQIEVSQSE